MGGGGGELRSGNADPWNPGSRRLRLRGRVVVWLAWIALAGVGNLLVWEGRAKAASTDPAVGVDGDPKSEPALSPIVSVLRVEALSPAQPDGLLTIPVSYLRIETPEPGAATSRVREGPAVAYFQNLGSASAPRLKVYGSVRDSGGSPIAEAEVTARIFNWRQGTRTDLLGRYELPELVGGVYEMIASAPGRRSERRVLDLGPASVRQDFRLDPEVVLPATEVRPPEMAPAVPGGTAPTRSTGRLMVFDGDRWKVPGEGLEDRPAAPPGLSTSLPTIVMTHGWIMCLEAPGDGSKEGVQGWPLSMARSLAGTGLDAGKVNLVAWDWYEGARACDLKVHSMPLPPTSRAPAEGMALGLALRSALGNGYASPIQFIGHSLGTLVNRHAADLVHGDLNQTLADPEPPWAPGFTQMMLFDDAAIASLVDGGILHRITERNGLLTTLHHQLWRMAQWDHPVPRAFNFLDNYISLTGRYHPEGVNVILQRKVVPALAGLAGEGTVQSVLEELHKLHTEPMRWYQNSFNHARPVVPGWGLSVARHALDPASVQPPAFDDRAGAVDRGQVWREPCLGSEYDLERLPHYPFLNQPMLSVLDRVIPASKDPTRLLSCTAIGAAIDGVGAMLDLAAGGLNWLGEQAIDGGVWLTHRAIVVGEAMIELVDDAGTVASGALNAIVNLRSRLRQVSPMDLGNYAVKISLRSRGGEGMPVRHAGLAGAAPPAWVWLPVRIPADATSMSFTFTAAGDGGEDDLVMGIGESRRFALGTRFISREETEQSGWIDVTDVAGTEVELFFGVVGGTSKDIQVTVADLAFRSSLIPRLEFGWGDEGLTLSWPASDFRWQLETTSVLEQGLWEPVDEVPGLSGGRYTVQVRHEAPERFYRLQRQP